MTVDPALTQPWPTTKRYRLEREKPVWSENTCTEDNNHVFVGKENYMISADGLLMPTRRDQPAPDARYFKPAAR